MRRGLHSRFLLLVTVSMTKMLHVEDLRKQDLSAVSRTQDTRDPVQCGTNIVVAALFGDARVKGHANGEVRRYGLHTGLTLSWFDGFVLV